MVKGKISKNKISKVIKEYLELVEKCFYIESVYLFGSYSKNKQKKYSDVDLALVSSDFKYMADEIAMKMLFRMARYIDSRIEPTVFTPDEIKKPLIGTLAWEVVNSGTKIK